ncbi:hypothetical protein [Burkholderia sp. MSMB0856]|nr:hypothetical protein [Burkholderia sp. MSMB0856]
MIMLLSISAALLTTLIIVLETAPPPSVKTVAPAGAPHHAREEK